MGSTVCVGLGNSPGNGLHRAGQTPRDVETPYCHFASAIYHGISIAALAVTLGRGQHRVRNQHGHAIHPTGVGTPGERPGVDILW